MGLITFPEGHSWERFEDLDSWKESRELTNQIYDAKEVKPFSDDFGLKYQIRRASVSIMSNIAEGFERGGDKEFIQFLSNSLGSAAEVRSQLYIAKDRNYISQSEFEELRDKSVEITKMIKSFLNYLKDSELEGRKYKPNDDSA